MGTFSFTVLFTIIELWTIIQICTILLREKLFLIFHSIFSKNKHDVYHTHASFVLNTHCR
jgi:hypothetical protein